MWFFWYASAEIENDIKGKKEFEDQILKLRTRKEILQRNIEEREKWNVRGKRNLTYLNSLCMDAKSRRRRKSYRNAQSGQSQKEVEQ